MRRSLSIAGTVVVALLVSFVLLSTSTSLAFARPLKHRPPLITISGTIVKTDSKFVLENPKRTLTVTGQDFTPYVGRKIRATGRVTKADGGAQIFEVTRIHHGSRKGR